MLIGNSAHDTKAVHKAMSLVCKRFQLWSLMATGVTVVAMCAKGTSAETVDFNRDIRPILSNKCFRCHGPDEDQREAGLRLDVRETAVSETESGAIPIVPGNIAASELVRRITSDDESERMPPADAKKSLTPEEIARLERWIAEGAPYSKHWSFAPLTRPAVPVASDLHWPRNEIDHFILSRLDQEGLRPAKEASRETLIRRLTLDLTGLPPTIEEIDAFLEDQEEDAYERVVDRLLASPHFGERMALDWLDGARFADTNGYHLDNGRDMTRWRAWVIEAFNHNLPFDQFTIWQLAGDLLAGATREQKIASGFHRNHMINFEGGAIPEEYHTAYIVDRVNTTGTVWLGLTIGCAQCHDHKFDPITQREYYQLYAFFNNVPEKGLDGGQGNAAPLLSLPTKTQARELRDIAARIAALEAQTQEIVSSADAGKMPQDEIREQLKAAREQKSDLEKRIPSTMVMQEMPEPRETFMLVRGQYDQKGDTVLPGVPASLSRLPVGAPADRLGLAQWLVSPQQPLTPRVIANRFWQLLFGVGLVRTTEDFGAQGEPPTHPELLDWLACQLRQTQAAQVEGSRAWNVKSLIKQLVMSATYRQDSRVTEAKLSADPDNRLLGRGPRFRLQAEFIRDQALAVSGLLKHQIGGRSVSPYQPAGLWVELSSRGDSAKWTAQFFQQSHGDDLYRRSMYTFWKRTCPPPQMLAFDAPDRETCTVRRARTNTPLQALILMNDPTYIEASRHMAQRILAHGGSADEQLSLAFRLTTARTPSQRELDVLQNVLHQQLETYRAHVDRAGALLAVGESAAPAVMDPAELAAWTMLCSAVLNLDETLTRK